MFRNIVLAVFVLAAVSMVAAQEERRQANGVITGTVLDANTRNPIEYANIVVKSLRDTTLVNGGISVSDGKFEVTALRPGGYKLEVFFLGYRTHRIAEVRLRPPQLTVDVGTIMLAPTTINMNTVEVEGQKAPISYQIDRKVISVDQQHTAASGTAVDVLENVPSVRVDIEGNVSLRGSGNFRVLIDGRPSILDPSEALQQIPASTIENIEIITNPSAKYDPEGTTGIINVVLKKNRRSGRSALANANAGLNEKYGGDFTTEYRTEEYSYVLGVDYNRSLYTGSEVEENQTTFQGIVSQVNSDGDTERSRLSMGGRAAFDWRISQSDLLSFGVRAGDRTGERNADLNFVEWTSPLNERRYYSNLTDRENAGYYYSLNTNYRHQYPQKGHELTFEAHYSRRESDESTLFRSFDGNNAIREGQRTTEDGPGSWMRMRLDYQRPLGTDQKVEAGYNSNFSRSTDNTALFEYSPAVNDFVLQDEYSNSTSYDRDIHALYSMYAGKWKALGFQAGLRGEYTKRMIRFSGENQPFTIDRWDYFPTMHLSYQFPKGQQLMASYTRRIDRPRGWYLEPYLTKTDAYNVRVGNPDLKPEYIDSYELGAQTYFGKTLLSVEAYYRKTNNKIERLRSVYSENVTLHSIDNVGTDYAFGSEFLLNMDVNRLWNINLMGNLFNYRVEGMIFDRSISRENFNWGMRMSNSLKVTRAFQLQLDGSYRSASVSSQDRDEGYFTLNGAVKYEIIERMLSATLQIRDILDSRNRESFSEGEGFYSYRYTSRESPVVMLNLRLNLNSERNRERRDRSSEPEMDEEF